mmetsp:Transcript_22771/g.40363  ORF Transcript_22771/g.40363 Transcript_22771/m.40363 type:complete len:572 (+) Transcript_22771:116-1831(+)
MRVRSDAFVHGAVQVGHATFWRDPDGVPVEAQQDRVDEATFDHLGAAVTIMRAAGLGEALVARDAELAGAIVQKGMSGTLGHAKGPTLEECVVLCQLYQALSRTIRNQNQTYEASLAVGEFAMLLLLQVWRELGQKQPVQDEMAVWTAADEQNNKENPGDSATRQGPRSPRTLVLQNFAKEHDAHLAFVKGHLKEILWLVALSSNQISRTEFLASWDTQELTKQQVQALNLIVVLDPSANNDLDIFFNSPLLRSSEILTKLESTLALDPLQNPVLSPGAQGPESSPAPGASQGAIVLSNIKRGTCIFPEIELPQQSSKLSPLLKSQSEPRPGGTVVNILDNLTVFDCFDASIYALQPAQNIRIVECHKCTIVLAPCAGILTLQHCSEITVIGIAGDLSICNTYDSFIHVHTLHGGPILSGECQNIQFGPYHTFYPRLNIHLAALDMTSTLYGAEQRYLWKSPRDISRRGLTKSFSLLNPGDLNIFVTPIPDPLVETPCTELVIELPKEYADAMEAKITSVKVLLQEVNRAGKERNGCDEQKLEQGIQMKFKEWLISSGNARQVMDLIKHQA